MFQTAAQNATIPQKPTACIEEILQPPQNIAAAIDSYIRERALLKRLEARIEKTKQEILKWVRPLWITRLFNKITPKLRFGGAITLNDSPLNMLQLVVQDWTSHRQVTDKQLSRLIELVGGPSYLNFISETVKYHINHEILNKPGVIEIIDKALSNSHTELVNSGKLTELEYQSLVKATRVRTINPKSLERIASYAQNEVQLTEIIEVLGTNVVTYLL